MAVFILPMLYSFPCFFMSTHFTWISTKATNIFYIISKCTINRHQDDYCTMIQHTHFPSLPCAVQNFGVFILSIFEECDSLYLPHQLMMTVISYNCSIVCSFKDNACKNYNNNKPDGQI